METHPDGYQHGNPKRTEISITAFCNESLNLSRKEVIYEIIIIIL